jgi:hypothetical protein
LLARNIEMSDGANSLGGCRVHPHALVAKASNERGRRAKLGIDFENHDVGIDDFGIESQAGGRANGFRNDSGVGMVVGEALDVVVEREECAGGDDAGLAPSSAERFAMAAGLADEIGRTAKRGADRRSEAFREADADCIEVAGPIGGRNARGNDGVEEAGAIQVASEAVLGGPAEDLGDGVVGLNTASASIVSVL